jgi:hypothetical protein
VDEETPGGHGYLDYHKSFPSSHASSQFSNE